jgi:hypothetical protein
VEAFPAGSVRICVIADKKADQHENPEYVFFLFPQASVDNLYKATSAEDKGTMT